MSQKSTDYMSAVNDVVSVCKEAYEGFAGAAKAAEDPSLKSMFEEYSRQRDQFARELESAINRAGGHAHDPSGIAGKAHSAWIRAKGAVTGHSAHEILEETERGEDRSMKRYQDALASNPPAEIRAVLEQQYQEVQSAHARIRSLRDSAGRK